MIAAATVCIAGPMADALKRNRELLNAKFAAAQRGGARIDRSAFLLHLSTVVDPIVRAVVSQFAEKTDLTTTALYELSLELFSESLLGPQTREQAVPDAWRRLLPVIPRVLVRGPRRVAASVTNAVHFIGQNTGARPAEWITRMAAIGAMCDDPQTFLEVGKVAAWISGCPQYRMEAIQIARSLPPAILAALLGYPQSTALPGMHKALDVMSVNPWLSPAEAASGADPRRLRMVRRSGSFRGFAGVFLHPPMVAAQGAQLIVTDGEGVWTLHADVFGCVFRRSTLDRAAPGKPCGPMELSSAGELRWDDAGASFPTLAGWNSLAFDGQTLAVTLPTSHHIFLIARG